ncbi:hypothetical protein GCM10009799_40610 [Nocardiopsis rhodophaea]|uniref:Type II toxin-antitoxin system VapB family antitoxin n=2 Tax=Nocardiopsis rhodophaea TaxID=280238 RepID=A0ABP5EV07_9ACTN
MSRTVLDIDDETLAIAADELGTTTKVETVNRALAEIAARRRSRDFLDFMDELDLDLSNETMEGAWH